MKYKTNPDYAQSLSERTSDTKLHIPNKIYVEDHKSVVNHFYTVARASPHKHNPYPGKIQLQAKKNVITLNSTQNGPYLTLFLKSFFVNHTAAQRSLKFTLYA